jgi:hypothetical protein
MNRKGTPEEAALLLILVDFRLVLDANNFLSDVKD